MKFGYARVSTLQNMVVVSNNTANSSFTFQVISANGTNTYQGKLSAEPLTALENSNPAPIFIYNVDSSHFNGL